MKQTAAWLCAALLVLAGFAGAELPATAAPPTAAWSGSAGGATAGVDLSATALDLADAQLATSRAVSGSGLTPRSTARSANLDAVAAGLLGLEVLSNTETQGPAAGTSSSSRGIAASVAPLLSVGALQTDDAASWAGDAACFTKGPLAQASTRTAGVKVDPLAVVDDPLLSTGVSTTTGTTRLVSTGGAGPNRGVESTATGTIADVSVLGLGIGVAGTTTLTTTATGSAGGASFVYNPGTITVTQEGRTTTISPGGSAEFTVSLAGALTATITVKANTPTTTLVNPAGTSATAAVSVVSVGVTVAPAVGPVVLTSSIDLLPLAASSVAPPGGIDCPAPLAPPVVTAPADGSRTDDTTPTFSGTGVEGATINLVVDSGTALNAVATVRPDGTWSYTPTTPLAEGEHTVRATQTLLGVTSATSGTNTFTVDTTAPPAPVLSTPANGSTTTDTTPTFTGTAERGATVRVVVDGTLIGTTTANGSGSFSYTPPTALAQGEHRALVQAVDQAGNVSDDSNTNRFTVDSVAPRAPVVQTPPDGSSTSDRTPTVTGTAEAGSTVEIFIDGGSIGTTRTTAAGTWTKDAPQLSEGTHTVYAVAVDAAGNDSPRSNENDFRIDATTPKAPVITGPADGSVIMDTTPAITGTAEPNAEVTLTIDGGSPVTVTADGSGNWTYQVPTALSEGTPHTVTATQTDAAGNTSPADTSTFTVDATAPAAPVIVTPTGGSTTDDPTPTISGTGEPGAEVTVTVGGQSLGPVPVGEDGNWSVTVGSDLADGDYTAVASQTDAAGNVSPTDSVDFTVDRPAGPVITSPGDGDVANSPVQICGTGEPGAVVMVTDKDGTELGTATVNGSGSWCITVALPAGGHAVIATQTDQAGNETASDPVSFVVARDVSGTGGGGTGSTGGGGTGSTGGGGTGSTGGGTGSTGGGGTGSTGGGSTGGGTGSGGGAGSNGGGGLLASTGGPGPAGLGLSALLLVGGAVSVLASRRRRQG